MSAIVHIDEAVGKTYSVFIATGGATEYLVRRNANLETQPRRNARDGGRAPGRVSYRPYLDRHGFGACDLQFEAWAGEASVRLGRIAPDKILYDSPLTCRRCQVSALSISIIGHKLQCLGR